MWSGQLCGTCWFRDLAFGFVSRDRHTPAGPQLLPQLPLFLSVRAQWLSDILSAVGHNALRTVGSGAGGGHLTEEEVVSAGISENVGYGQSSCPVFLYKHSS
jgi:hypothetical protein